MTRIVRRFGLAVAVLGLMAGLCRQTHAAITLDFHSGTFSAQPGISFPGSYNNVYQQSGFTVKTLDPFNHFDGTGSLGFHLGGDNKIGPVTVKTDFGGVSFDLLSLTIIQNPGTLTFTSSTGTTMSLSGTGNFTFNWNNIASFTIDTNSNDWSYLDDFQVQPGVAAVPEPSSIALVCTALPMGLGLAWKRRRNAVMV